jgi:hypothetical protein
VFHRGQAPVRKLEGEVPKNLRKGKKLRTQGPRKQEDRLKSGETVMNQLTLRGPMIDFLRAFSDYMKAQRVSWISPHVLPRSQYLWRIQTAAF